MTDTNEDIKDLIVLVPDNSIRATIQGLLLRSVSLGISAPNFDIFVHPQHDPGCRTKSSEFFRGFINRYRFAVVIFDLEGCGAENKGRNAVELVVENNLARNGWPERSAAIILDPELEIWVWSQSLRVDAALGWTGHDPPLRSWLVDQNFVETESEKPNRPKEAFEAAIKAVRKPKSSAIFAKLAETVDFSSCRDPAFNKLVNLLQQWFPITPSHPQRP